mmetsp:Transcript_42069/g.125860  ORF Transcript_42069/g.125860 Transcript_42069/m.125860 type:complete len:217 (+) Transcript_42069:107-757(+)
MTSTALEVGMWTSSTEPLRRSSNTSPGSKTPSWLRSKLWNATCSDTAKSSREAGRQSAANSDHSIWPSLSKSAASAACAACLGLTPSLSNACASSLRLSDPRFRTSISSKTCSSISSVEPGSLEAACKTVARQRRMSSRSCVMALTSSFENRTSPWCVVLGRRESQGMTKHSCALGRRFSENCNILRMTSCAAGLADATCSMGGPRCCAAKSASRP